jgi:hypothetical protein
MQGGTPYVFKARCLIKHNDDFTFTFSYIEGEKQGMKAKNMEIGGIKTKGARKVMEQTNIKEERKINRDMIILESHR